MELILTSEEYCLSTREILLNREIDETLPIVVCYGGGKNSTAMLILLQRLGIIPDLILFADTGGELPQTYEYIEMFKEWLKNNGMPEIMVVRKKPGSISPTRSTLVSSKKVFNYSLRWAILIALPVDFLAFCIWSIMISIHQYSTLEEQCLVTQSLPSKAYGRSNCSIMWKVEPQELFIKKWKLDNNIDSKIIKMIGYHAGESSRMFSKSTKQPFLEDDLYINEYPLIKYGIDEFSCLSIIKSANIDTPSKSSCFFCPSRKIPEILDLPEHYLKRSQLIEQVHKDGIHYRKSSIVGLGRRFSWSSLSEITDIEKAIIESSSHLKTCQCIDG